MAKVIAINGSPSMKKGNTAIILDSFIEGTKRDEVEVLYTKRLNIKPCTGDLNCWYMHPGECHIQDDMQLIYPKLREAEFLVLATPVYIPLPGEMQNIINRLCPLIQPLLETRRGRTSARLHPEIKINTIALLAVGGWWEKSNFDTVVRIAKELAQVMSVNFAGAVLRPHAYQMKVNGILTTQGKDILKGVKQAGFELVNEGKISRRILEAICRPLISEEDLLSKYNESLKKVQSRLALK